MIDGTAKVRVGTILEVVGGPVGPPSTISYRVVYDAEGGVVEWPAPVQPTDRRFTDAWDIDATNAVGKKVLVIERDGVLLWWFGYVEMPATEECDTTGGGP